MSWKKDITEQLQLIESSFNNKVNNYQEKINNVIDYLESTCTTTPLSISPIKITEHSNFSSIEMYLYLHYGLKQEYVIDFYNDKTIIYKNNN